MLPAVLLYIMHNSLVEGAWFHLWFIYNITKNTPNQRKYEMSTP